MILWFYILIYFTNQVMDLLSADFFWNWHSGRYDDSEHKTKIHFKKLLDNFRPDTPIAMKKIFISCVRCNFNERQNFKNVSFFYKTFVIL